MPKLGRMTEEQKEYRNELRKAYGEHVNLTQVQRIIGRQDKAARRWLEDLTPTGVNGRRSWWICDIADKLYHDRMQYIR